MSLALSPAGLVLPPAELILPPGYEVPLNRGRPALVGPDDLDHLRRRGWTLRLGNCDTGGGYAISNIRRPGLPSVTVPMHLVVMARMGFFVPPGYEVDHINWDTLDNRRENLRVLTVRENNLNKQLRQDNTSGHPGVTAVWRKGRRFWAVSLAGVYYGSYDTLGEAVRVRERAFARHVDLSHKAFPLGPEHDAWLRLIRAY